MLETQECFSRLYELATKFNIPLNEYKNQDFCTGILAHEIAHWILSDEVEKQKIKDGKLHCCAGVVCVEDRDVIFEKQEDLASLLGLFILNHVGDLRKSDYHDMGLCLGDKYDFAFNSVEEMYKSFWTNVSKLNSLKVLDGNKLIAP